MDLLTLIIALVAVGVVLYVINRWIPMEPRIKTALNWAVIIFLILYGLNLLGILDAVRSIHIGR